MENDMPQEIFFVTATVTVVGLIVAISTGVFKVGKWVGGVNEHRSTVTSFMERIEKKVDQLFGRVSPSIQGSSPTRLTDLGKKISEDMDARGWAVQIADDLLENAEGKEPYEIQEIAFDYVRNEFPRRTGPEQIAEIKRVAFENGIDSQAVLDVIAVEVRDVLLGEDV